MRKNFLDPELRVLYLEVRDICNESVDIGDDGIGIPGIGDVDNAD